MQLGGSWGYSGLGILVIGGSLWAGIVSWRWRGMRMTRECRIFGGFLWRVVLGRVISFLAEIGFVFSSLYTVISIT